VKVPKTQYSNPAQSGGVYRGLKTSAALGKSTESALNRRMKLSDALGKFQSAGKSK
jgi:hypothetical protein